METTILNYDVEKKTDIISEAKSELKQMILDEGIVLGSSYDKNGKSTRWNLDSKAILLNPRGLFLTSILFMEKLKEYNVSHIGGLTMASHLITSSLVFLDSFTKNKYNGFLIRKEKKNYGLAKQIEGIVPENSDVAIIDDGLNAAGFATRSIEMMEKLGCSVKSLIILINFERGENTELKNKGYNIDNIFTLKELGLDPRQTPKFTDMFNLVWKYGIINKSSYTAPKSTPFINDNGIYIGSDQNKILAIDFSGKLKWEFNTDYNQHGVHSSPIVFDGKVICSSYSGYLYVLNEEDGSLIWKNKACDFIGSSPIIDSKTRTIYVGLENRSLKGTMAAFDFNTGNLLWEFVTNNHVPSKPELFGDIIVFGSNDFNLYACNKNNGKLIWKFSMNGEQKGSPTIDTETKKVYATSFDGHLYCIELYNGTLLWKKKLGYKLYNKPLIYDNKVFVGSYSGQVSALDKHNDKVKWFFMTEDSIQSSPFEENGIIYIGSNDGNIYALDSKNGELLWKYKTESKITSSPRIYRNKLFVSSNDGYLYCFEKNEK